MADYNYGRIAIAIGIWLMLAAFSYLTFRHNHRSLHNRWTNRDRIGCLILCLTVAPLLTIGAIFYWFSEWDSIAKNNKWMNKEAKW